MGVCMCWEHEQDLSRSMEVSLWFKSSVRFWECVRWDVRAFVFMWVCVGLLAHGSVCLYTLSR